MKNIVLIGMPGAGKTTHGKAIANRFGLEFFDTDQMIEAVEGMPCNRVFETKGEEAFREIECRMVAEASREESGRVISIGGGAVLSADNVAALKKTGMLIFINRRIKIMSHGFVEKRPTLKGEGALKRVAAKRMPIYHKIADYELRYDIRRRAQSIVASLRPISEYAVIGDPIMHSFSPQLYSDLDYQKIWVKEKFLPDFIAAFRESKILKGINVTAPFKKKIIDYIDGLRGDAELFGNVNTVVKADGKLIGYNTDIDGLFASIREVRNNFRGGKILVIGTGAVAQNICKAISKGSSQSCGGVGGGETKAAAAGGARAEETLRKVRAAGTCEFTGSCEMVSAREPDKIAETIADKDVIIQATSLGMEGCSEDYEDLSFLANVKRGALVYDLVYAPSQTTFLREARARGLMGVNGFGMLKKQAEFAAKIFAESRQSP